MPVDIAQLDLTDHKAVALAVTELQLEKATLRKSLDLALEVIEGYVEFIERRHGVART